MNNAKVPEKILELLKIILKDTGLKVKDNSATLILSSGKPLLNISTTGMEIPGIAIANNLFSTPSPLKDSFVPYQQVGKLVNHLVSGNLFQRLNHLGFCYQVKSIADEKE